VHSVIEAVGTQESMLQAIRSTRVGGHVGHVGVSHDVALPGKEMFFPMCTCTAARLPYAASCPS
jgi:threonine dehydrogenase-like Zn-dependent dehydrogenase